MLGHGHLTVAALAANVPMSTPGTADDSDQPMTVIRRRPAAVHLQALSPRPLPEAPLEEVT